MLLRLRLAKPIIKATKPHFQLYTKRNVHRMKICRPCTGKYDKPPKRKPRCGECPKEEDNRIEPAHKLVPFVQPTRRFRPLGTFQYHDYEW